jgi:hypothetical protein
MLVGMLALAVGLAMAAPPALAGPPPSVKPNQTPLAAAAAAVVEGIPSAALAQAGQTAPVAPAATSSKSFFKTPTGIVALVLTAGIAAWTIESRINNKVTSPGRQ